MDWPPRLPRRRRRRAGLTLVEAAITVALFGVVLGAVALVTESSTRSLQTGAAVTDVQGRLHGGLDRIADLVRATRLDAVDPTPAAPFHSELLDLQRVEGFGPAGIAWSSPERIHLEHEPGEVDDGLDNDGDGLIDECRIVHTQAFGLAGERAIVLCTSVREWLEGELPANGLDDNGNGLVDERGLSFDFDEGRITIRISLEELGPSGMTITRTLATTIALRNSDA
jgi:hypothetical protein